MFDSLLKEIASKFGLGNKASWVLSTLLGLIFNKGSGGMSGFLDKLTSGGLGKIVSSWIGKGDSMPVNSTQIESAMGSDVIGNLASKLDLPSEPVGMAIAHMLPKVVNALTPDGVIPDNLPANLAQYMKDDGHQELGTTESNATQGKGVPNEAKIAGAAAVAGAVKQSQNKEVVGEPEIKSQYKSEEVIKEPKITETTAEYQHNEVVSEPEVKSQYRQQDYAHVSEPNDEGFKFRWWWLLLPLFLLLGWCGLKQPDSITTPDTTAVPDTPTAVPEAVVEPEPAPVAPVTTINPSLSISNEADGFHVSGTVADEGTKDTILGMLKSSFGSEKVNSDILVDSAADSAGWLDKLSGILPALKDAAGSKLFFDGNDIALDGNINQGIIDSLMGKLNTVFGGSGFNISSNAIALPSAEGVTETVAEPIAEAKEAATDSAEAGNNAIQDMTTSGTVTGEELVKALNIAGINFDTGSFKITSKSMAMLSDAAKAINAAPADTKIQVGGHTDNTGSSQLNENLSKQRAQVVVDTLVEMGVDVSKLSSQGYGDSQPIADNNTAEGRTENRRMEFTLQ